jgi:hypothetical protein
MNNAAWMELFRSVPTNLRHKLMVLTRTGIELAVQELLRLEETYVLIRGRVAGTSDTGRVFIVPYEQICYAGFSHQMKQEEVESMYGDRPPAMVLPAPDKVPSADIPAEAPSEAPAEATPASKPKVAPLSAPKKSELLQRLRSRSHHGSAMRPR